MEYFCSEFTFCNVFCFLILGELFLSCPQQSWVWSLDPGLEIGGRGNISVVCLDRQHEYRETQRALGMVPCKGTSQGLAKEKKIGVFRKR